MNKNIEKVKALAEHIGSALSVFMSDGGYTVTACDLVHKQAREVIKNELFEMLLKGEVSFHPEIQVLKGYPDFNDFESEYPMEGAAPEANPSPSNSPTVTARDDFQITEGDTVMFARRCIRGACFPLGEKFCILSIDDNKVIVNSSAYYLILTREEFFDCFDPLA